MPRVIFLGFDPKFSSFLELDWIIVSELDNVRRRERGLLLLLSFPLHLAGAAVPGDGSNFPRLSPAVRQQKRQRGNKPRGYVCSAAPLLPMHRLCDVEVWERASLAGERWRRQMKIRSHQQTSQTSSGVTRPLGTHIYLTRAMPWCFLDFCLLLLLSPGFRQCASILLEVQ